MCSFNSYFVSTLPRPDAADLAVNEAKIPGRYNVMEIVHVKCFKNCEEF